MAVLRFATLSARKGLDADPAAVQLRHTVMDAWLEGCELRAAGGGLWAAGTGRLADLPS
jgi:hypothetical protein